jgi:aryl-alcohol dehydrogenase-like predicted oxidoreductase
MERDLLPMCRSEGMAIAPWGAIGQGRFQRAKDIGQSKDGRSSGALTDSEKKVNIQLYLTTYPTPSCSLSPPAILSNHLLYLGVEADIGLRV